MLKINDKALDFSLPDSEGVFHKLSDYLGKKIVLYFYPKDNTSGCTNQALEFKRLYDEYKNNNIVILGVSKDTISSHCKFKNKYDLPFVILSNESTEVLNAYGVFKEKSMYGKKIMGVIRTTFIINEEGYIEKIYEKANSSKNPQEVLEYLLK